MQVEVKNLAGESVGTAELSDAVFGADVREDILHRVVRWQLAKRRSGTHKVKGRSEVSGSTAKIYKQKGTGRARHGAKRGTMFRGGGIVFGPTPRDHGFDLPKKVRKLGLRGALSSKARDGKLIVVDAVTMSEPKTKVLRGTLDGLGLDSALFVVAGEADRNFALASRNIPLIDLLSQEGANVYDILRRDTLVLTRDAAKLLEERLQ
ncbi:MAG: 50S ribosomal protein L4 [Geminicoccaceae bacterium]|nr:50S ribosomal protein L4 [Geminicoccaceae bacterium]